MSAAPETNPQAPEQKAKGTRKPKPRQIHPYLPPELVRALKLYSAGKGKTESSVIEAALKDYLDGTSDKALLMKRLNRIKHNQDRHTRDLQVLTEAFAVFMEFWFAHTPQILGEGAKDEARRIASERFGKYRDLVAKRLSGRSSRFLNDVVQDVPDPEELKEKAPPKEAA